MVLTEDAIAVLTSFFDYVDTDNDGFISVDEIRAAMAVDVDGDGSTTEAEIVASARPWLDAFNTQDLNGDSTISLAELLEYNS